MTRHYCGVAPDHQIRPATDGDLPALAGALGQETFFADRLRRQHAGLGVLLTAWAGDEPGTEPVDGEPADAEPVGVVYVWLEEAEERELREHLPGVPLLNHLEVRDGWRNQLIGTSIIHAAESLLVGKGFKQVALGIRLDNLDAARLYERLGYAEWEHGEIETSYVVFLADGGEDRAPEMCRILVKDLPPTAAATEG